MTLTRTCKHCKAEFEAQQLNAKFCSRLCADLYAATYKRRERGSARAPYQCEGPDCDKTVMRTPSAVKDNVFCSRLCRINWKRSQQETRTCCNQKCGKMFLVPFTKPTQRFCCKACAREMQNALSAIQKAHRAEVMAGPDFVDVASYLGEITTYSSLFRGQGDLSQAHPFETDVYVGF